VLAVDALASGGATFAAYNVESPLPFTADDARDLRSDPLRAIQRHWPDSADLLRERGAASLKPVTEVFTIDRLRDELGWRPQHDFGTWLDEVRATPSARATGDPPWP
jgi:hypothetical protein